jgi:hypothetical protein
MRFTYDVFARPVQTEDALGNVTVRRFDKLGNLLVECMHEKQADGSFLLLARRQFTYDELGRRITAAASRLSPTAIATAPSGVLFGTHSAAIPLCRSTAPDSRPALSWAARATSTPSMMPSAEKSVPPMISSISAYVMTRSIMCSGDRDVPGSARRRSDASLCYPAAVL